MQLIPKLCNTVLILVFLLVLTAGMKAMKLEPDREILAALFVALQIRGGSDVSGSK